MVFKLLVYESEEFNFNHQTCREVWFSSKGSFRRAA